MLKAVAQWFPYCKLSSLDEFGAPHFKKSLESTVAEIQVFVGGCAAMVDGAYHHSYLITRLFVIPFVLQISIVELMFLQSDPCAYNPRVNITQRDLTFGIIKRG